MYRPGLQSFALLGAALLAACSDGNSPTASAGEHNMITARVSAAATPGRPFVSGGGQHLAFGTGPGIIAFGVTAHGSGLDASGELTFTQVGTGEPAAHGFVTCLIVTGNDAIATGVLTKPPASAGQTVVMEAVDNGTPGQSSVPDRIRFSFAGFIVPSSTPGCFLPILAPVPLVEGNIVVKP